MSVAVSPPSQRGSAMPPPSRLSTDAEKTAARSFPFSSTAAFCIGGEEGKWGTDGRTKREGGAIRRIGSALEAVQEGEEAANKIGKKRQIAKYEEDEGGNAG